MITEYTGVKSKNIDIDLNEGELIWITRNLR